MLQFRAMQDGDLDALTRLVERVWEMDSMCGGHETGWYMAREYLLKTFSHSTSVQIALWEQKVAGFLALDDKSRPSPIRLDRMEIPQELHTKEIETMRARMAEYDQLCARLLKASGRPFDGEITLFAVEPSLQGKGIGTALFEWARAYFDRKEFFLYTDTGCNYSFYDAHRMRCLAKQPYRNPYQEKKAFYIFLYANATAVS